MIVTLKNQKGNLMDIKDIHGEIGIGNKTTLEILCALNKFIDRNKIQYVISDETTCVTIECNRNTIIPDVRINGEPVDFNEFRGSYSNLIYTKYGIDEIFYKEISRYVNLLMYLLNNY